MSKPISRRRLLKSSLAAAAASGLVGAAGEHSVPAEHSHSGARPDIVIIYLDDLGYGDLGCQGSPEARTPHIDALARSGVRFTEWYSNSPVCSPSRASLLTGRYPSRAGVRTILGGARGSVGGLDASQTTIAAALKPFGYRTALFGKWHLGTAPECLPMAHGFDRFFGFLAGCVDYYSHIFYWGMRGGRSEGIHDLWENDREVWMNGRYLTEVIGEMAVSYIENAPPDPFLLYLPFNAPHYPMHAPQTYLDRFPGVPPDRRILHAMVAAVDDAVGSVVAALKNAGRYENTIVFFSSDNGPSNEHANWLDGRTTPYTGTSAGGLKGGKGCLFEGGIRVPAIMSWPNHLPAGRVCSEPLAMMDLFPTLLSTAGGDVSACDLDGRDLLPAATGARSPHERIFWEYDGQLAVREDNWKLVLDGRLDFSRKAADPVSLCDLATDPFEQTNLASREPAMVKALTAKAREWLASVALAGRV